MADTPLIYVAALVAYDGTDFHGFQFQQGVPTIQGALEQALDSIVKSPARVVAAGRTDTGVHASGQVVSVRIPWRHSCDSLQRAWNANLPPAISIRRVRIAPDKFHPRFSAGRRTYRYTIFCNSFVVEAVYPKSLPLADRFALYIPERLDIGAMQAASRHLLGNHDFATFGQPPQGENTVRNLFRADWHVVRSDLPSLSAVAEEQIVFTVTATAFLRRMIRNLVGMLLEVGRGKLQVSDVKQALDARDRSRCVAPVAPNGLVLERVDYPAFPDLFV